MEVKGSGRRDARASRETETGRRRRRGPRASPRGRRRLGTRRITALGSVAGRTQSRGSSVDFCADGFDDISVPRIGRGGGRRARRGGEDVGVFLQRRIRREHRHAVSPTGERTPVLRGQRDEDRGGTRRAHFAEAFAARKYLRPGVLSLRVDGREVAIPPGAGRCSFSTSTRRDGHRLFRMRRAERARGIAGVRTAEHRRRPDRDRGDDERVASRRDSTRVRTQPQGGAGRASVEMVLREPLRVQVDGEPWLQPPAVIRLH